MFQTVLQMIASTPIEMASWGLMIVGFGLAGQMLRLVRSRLA